MDEQPAEPCGPSRGRRVVVGRCCRAGRLRRRRGLRRLDRRHDGRGRQCSAAAGLPRPALAAVLPAPRGPVVLLDVGRTRGKRRVARPVRPRRTAYAQVRLGLERRASACSTSAPSPARAMRSAEAVEPRLEQALRGGRRVRRQRRGGRGRPRRGGRRGGDRRVHRQRTDQGDRGTSMRSPGRSGAPPAGRSESRRGPARRRRSGGRRPRRVRASRACICALRGAAGRCCRVERRQDVGHGRRAASEKVTEAHVQAREDPPPRTAACSPPPWPRLWTTGSCSGRSPTGPTPTRTAACRPTSGWSSSATPCSAWSSPTRSTAGTPTFPEGQLAKLRASGEHARPRRRGPDHRPRGGIGPWILLGRGEEATGGREKLSILADTLEALIGAVYESSGIEVASGSGGCSTR